MPLSRPLLLLVALASTWLPSCDGGDGDPPPPTSVGAEEMQCAAGSRPDYFVPGEPAKLIGCARLGLSSKPVEFSIQPVEAGAAGVCINPAFRGRGYAGMYIPARCFHRLPEGQVEVLGVRVPRQGVRGYGRVVWGVTAPGVTALRLTNEEHAAHAVVFGVEAGLARRLGARGPFGVFVAEFPATSDRSEWTANVLR